MVSGESEMQIHDWPLITHFFLPQYRFWWLSGFSKPWRANLSSGPWLWQGRAVWNQSSLIHYAVSRYIPQLSCFV